MVARCNFKSKIPQASAGYTLQAVDQHGEGDFRRKMDQQMDVIVFAVAYDQLCFNVFADLGETMPQVLYGAFGEHVLAVFSDKDQVNMQGKTPCLRV